MYIHTNQISDIWINLAECHWGVSSVRARNIVLSCKTRHQISTADLKGRPPSKRAGPPPPEGYGHVIEDVGSAELVNIISPNRPVPVAGTGDLGDPRGR